MTTEQMVKGAFDRARGRRATVSYRYTTQHGTAVYIVDSATNTDEAYTVTVLLKPRQERVTGRYGCTCHSGARNRPCWHIAAVFNVRSSREAFGLPADGNDVGSTREIVEATL